MVHDPDRDADLERPVDGREHEPRHTGRERDLPGVEEQDARQAGRRVLGIDATPDELGRGRPFYYFAYGAAVSEVTIDTLVAAGFISSNDKVKILGNGAITKALTVKAHAFSKSAEAAITAAGGNVEKL